MYGGVLFNRHDYMPYVCGDVMPCPDYQSQYYETMENKTNAEKAREHGKISGFLCELCESISAHQLLSMRDECSQETLAHWYMNHLFQDFQINPCEATRSKLGREAIRIAEGLK